MSSSSRMVSRVVARAVFVCTPLFALRAAVNSGAVGLFAVDLRYGIEVSVGSALFSKIATTEAEAARLLTKLEELASPTPPPRTASTQMSLGPDTSSTRDGSTMRVPADYWPDSLIRSLAEEYGLASQRHRHHHHRHRDSDLSRPSASGEDWNRTRPSD